MAIKVNRNKNVPAKEKSTEQLLKDQQERIKKLEGEKIELQVLAAEMCEKAEMDKAEMQTALAELAEAIYELFE